MSDTDGYRVLSQEDKDLINKIKEAEQQVLRLVNLVREKLAMDLYAATGEDRVRHLKAEPERWASIGRTHFQEGFSALVRSVAQPGGL